jgi:hypothetical protein
MRRHVEALQNRPELAELYERLADQIAGSLLARPK